MPYRGRAEEDKKCKAEWLLALGDTRNAIGTNNIVQAESSRITFSPSLERPESGEILRTAHIQAPTSQYAPRTLNQYLSSHPLLFWAPTCRRPHKEERISSVCQYINGQMPGKGRGSWARLQESARLRVLLTVLSATPHPCKADPRISTVPHTSSGLWD